MQYPTICIYMDLPHIFVMDIILVCNMLVYGLPDLNQPHRTFCYILEKEM